MCEVTEVLAAPAVAAREPIELTLPGTIHPFGDHLVLDVIPMAGLRVRSDDVGTPRFLFAYLALADPADADPIIMAASRHAETRRPDSVSLRVATTDRLSDILGRGRAESQASVRFALTIGGEPIVSEPIAGTLRLDAKRGAKALKARGERLLSDPICTYLPCHSHWQNSPGVGNWTKCHGPCLWWSCNCYSFAKGRWQSFCYHWMPCICW